MKLKFAWREQTMAAMFLIPAAIGMLVFYYYPIAYTFVLSAFDLNYTADLSVQAFVGLRNYAGVLTSAPFWGFHPLHPLLHGGQRRPRTMHRHGAGAGLLLGLAQADGAAGA